MRLALLGSLIVVAACERPPAEVVRRAAELTAQGRVRGLRPWLHPDYADPLGDGAVLLSELRALYDAHPPREFRYTVQSVEAAGRLATVHAAVEARFDGEPRISWSGEAPVELARWGGFRLQAGWLTPLRDVVGLADAWTHARATASLEAIRAVVHPAYADGLDRREDVEAQWTRFGPEEVAVTLVRLETRDESAHLDLHELTRGPTGLVPRIHRLTLRSAAGRWRVAAGLRFEPEAPL